MPFAIGFLLICIKSVTSNASVELQFADAAGTHLSNGGPNFFFTFPSNFNSRAKQQNCRCFLVEHVEFLFTKVFLDSCSQLKVLGSLVELLYGLHTGKSHKPQQDVFASLVSGMLTS